MTIKVLHIIGSLRAGGAETLLLHFLKNWNDPSFTHSVWYIRPGEDLKDNFDDIGIPTQELHWRSELGVTKFPKLVRLLKRERPHIVHSHLWWANYIIAAASRAARVPLYVETIHDSFEHGWKGRIAHKILRPVHVTFTDSIVCVSEGVHSHITGKFRHPRRNVRVIYNGIGDITLPEAEAPRKMRHDLGIGQNVPVLITVANLIPRKKGYEILLESLKQIVQGGTTDFCMLIVGADDTDFPEFSEELKQKARDYGLEDIVRFLGYRKDIPELLSASDIFVLPSLWEGLPMAIIEAMRSSLPVIATDVGGNREAVAHDITGLVVEPGNAERLAEAITGFLGDQDMQREMGRQGRRHFERNFTIKTTVKKYAGLYRELLAKKSINLN